MAGFPRAGAAHRVRARPVNQPPAVSKLLAIQVLRALAALAVAMHHAQHDAVVVAERAGLPFSRSDILPWLAGVDVFFVISGFIMVHASAGLFGTEGAATLFLKRRVARIVPLYWLVTTAYVVVAIIAPQLLNSGTPTLLQVIASYLFIPFARPDGLVQPIYSLGWTLNYEMFFYLVFAAALALPRLKAVLAVALGLAMFVLVGRLAAPLPQPSAFWSDPIILEFVFGMGLGLVRAHGLRLAMTPRLLLAGVAVVLLHFDFANAGGIVRLPQVIAYGLPAAMLVAAAALGRDTPRPPVVERVLVALGDASYALYLVHPFALRLLREVFVRTDLAADLGPWGYVASALLASVVAALLLYRLFERPMTRALRNASGA